MTVLPGAEIRPRSLYAKGAALVLLAGLMWSFTGLLIRSAPTADGWQYLAYRAVGTAAAILVWGHLRDHGPMLARIRGTGWLGVAATILVSISATGFILAMKETTVANALFLTSTGPLLAVALGALILREKPTALGLVAIAIGLGGVVIMVQGSVGAGKMFGNAMALLSAAAFACQAICLRLARGRDFSSLVFANAVLTFFVGLVATLALGNGLISGWTDVLVGFVNGFVFMSVGSTLYVMGSKYVPAASLAFLAQTEQIFGPVWVWLAYGEKPLPTTLAGGVVILLAVGLMGWSGVRAQRIAHP